MNATEEMRLIRRAQNDIAEFSPLYRQYVHLVWNYCLARLRDDDRAADATSITFLKAMKALPRYAPEIRGEMTTFRSWLMTIARNVVMDELRKRPASPLNDHAMHLTSHEPGPEEIAVANDRKREILRGFAQLSDQQQDVIRLRQQGLSGEEIAAAMGISVGAVKSTHYRAIQRLRELLEKGERS